MSEPELKRCPHCGGEAEFDNASYDDANGHHPRFTAECCNLECVGWVFHDSKELAAKAWNNRHQPCDKYEKLLTFVKEMAELDYDHNDLRWHVGIESARELLREIGANE